MTQQGMSTKSRHLTIPDLITIGVFTALYFVLVAVATLFSSVALMGFGMILLLRTFHPFPCCEHRVSGHR